MPDRVCLGARSQFPTYALPPSPRGTSESAPEAPRDTGTAEQHRSSSRRSEQNRCSLFVLTCANLQPMDNAAPPPPDLDVVAARAAAALFLRRVASGATRPGAWNEAVALFSRHHPQWSAATLERETVRTLKAMIFAMELVPETLKAPEAVPAITPADRLKGALAILLEPVKLSWRGPAAAH